MNRAKVRRAENRVSALDVALFVIAGVLLAGIAAMVFGAEKMEIPTSVSVIWWTFVSLVGAWIASWGM